MCMRVQIALISPFDSALGHPQQTQQTQQTQPLGILYKLYIFALGHPPQTPHIQLFGHPAQTAQTPHFSP